MALLKMKKPSKTFEAKHDEQPRTMNVRQFAEKHHQLNNIKLWGNPSICTCVTVDDVDYLWSIVDGKYEGWIRRSK